MAKEKVRLWDRLKYKYKLSVINETSYDGGDSISDCPSCMY